MRALRSDFFFQKQNGLFLRGLLLGVIAWVFAAPALGLAQADKPRENPVVETIRIEITGDAGDAAEMEKLARRLICMEEGRVFSDAAFSSSVEALKRSKIFSEVDVPDPDWDKEAIELLFRLKPFPRIKDLRIDGAFPLLDKEVRNVMTIATGDIFVPGALSEQEAKIEELFAGEGYIDPKVRLSAEKDPADGHMIVSVHIRKGPFYHVKEVIISGNAAFSDIRLIMRLQTWQSSNLLGGASRFIEKELAADIKTLRQFYRKKGYCEVYIDRTVQKDPDTGRVRVRMDISEGPLYQIDFSGNEAFWGFTLKKDLVLFSEGNPNGFGLRKSIRNIRERYQAAGYPDVRVRADEPAASPDKEGIRPIVLAIAEGPRHIVRSVQVDGNQAFDGEKIRKQMITVPPGGFHDGAYVPDILAEDIRAIKSLYLEAGYRQVSVGYEAEKAAAPSGSDKTSGSDKEDKPDKADKPDKEDKPDTIHVDVRLKIDEGPRTIVESVSVEGASDITLKQPARALTMNSGTPFRDYLLKSEQRGLAAMISEAGYPHVTVTPEFAVSGDGESAEIVYNVKPGPYVEMGRAFFAGNFKTRESVLNREMAISRGEPFSLSRMLASQRNIRSVAAVAGARFQTFGLAGDVGGAEPAGQVDMLAEIEEIKPYFVETAAGYDTRRLFYINLAGGNRNLLGLNKQLRAALEWSQIGHRAEMDLTEPRFFGTRITSSMSLYTEVVEELNKNFGLRTHGASLGLSRELSKALTANLNFQFEYREQYRTDDLPVAEEEKDAYEPRSILVTTPALVYNTTDSFVRPSRGVRAAFSVDASKGLQNSLDDFFKYRLDGRYYFTPLNRLTLAAHGRLGYIEPFGKKSRIPEDQLFFLGGITDVRGFSENRLRFDEENDPVGGRVHILGSAEARLELGLNFELALFYDTGAVRKPLVAVGKDEFRSSAGIGLRYITPIGPIGGMYGWKLDRKSGEDPGAFHFAIGYTF